ncbi:MAG: chromate transporter [Thermotogota bacterium]
MFNMVFIFFKIGFIAFGGGWASLGIIKQQILDNGLLTEKALQEAISISQMTPGPVAVNVATYVGYLKYGFFGALLNNLFLIIPPILLFFLARYIIHKLKIDKKRVTQALKMGTIILISVTFISVLSPVVSEKDIFSGIIASIALYLFMKTRIDPIYIILGSAVLGMFIFS